VRPRARARGKKVFLRQDSNVFPCGAFAPRLLSALGSAAPKSLVPSSWDFCGNTICALQSAFSLLKKRVGEAQKEKRHPIFRLSGKTQAKRPHRIEGTAPSAALCEATTPSLRSPTFLAYPRHHHCRPVALFVGGLPAARLAGCSRWGWPMGASGWSEKHPRVAAEPGRPPGTGLQQTVARLRASARGPGPPFVVAAAGPA
jgi:hypothetical protein